MGLFKSRRKDLTTAPKLALDWSAQNIENSLNKVFEQATSLSDEAISWYVFARKPKKRGAQIIRILAIVLGGFAAVLPTISEMYPNGNGSLSFSPGWSTVLLGAAGALLLLDRFFGFSSGWMRYIVAELQLRQISQEFQLDWQTERASWQGATPSRDHVNQMLARCKAFISQVNTIVREETSTWVQEFQDTIKHLDESIKAKPAITEPGALNLTIENADLAPEGWTLIINDGTPEKYKGNSAGKRNLVPGKHLVRVIAKVEDRLLQDEKVVSIPAGGICEQKMTLS